MNCPSVRQVEDEMLLFASLIIGDVEACRQDLLDQGKNTRLLVRRTRVLGDDAYFHPGYAHEKKSDDDRESQGFAESSGCRKRDRILYAFYLVVLLDGDFVGTERLPVDEFYRGRDDLVVELALVSIAIKIGQHVFPPLIDNG